MSELSPNPNISYNEIAVAQASAINVPRVLIVGQSNAANTSGIYKGIQNKNLEDLETRYTKGQHLTRMIKLGLGMAQRTNKRPIIDVFAFPDTDLTTPTSASATLLCTAFTKTETIKITIGNDILKYGILNKYSVTALEGETGGQVATKIVSAITNDSNSLFTAVVNGVTAEQIDLTAKNSGVAYNGIPIFIENQQDLVGGSVTVTASANGTGDLNTTIQNAIVTAIADTRYNVIISPYTTQDNIIAELIARNTPVGNKILDGVLYSGIVKNNADTQVYLTSQNATTRKAFVVPCNGLVENNKLRGARYLIEPSLSAIAYGMMQAIISTDKASVSDYIAGVSFSYPALFSRTVSHNYILDFIKDSGEKDDLNIAEIQALNGTLFDKEDITGVRTVTNKIFTMSTHPQYRTIESEAKSQFLKEFIMTTVGFEYRQYTITDEVQAQKEIKAFVKNQIAILSGATGLVLANGTSRQLRDFQVLLTNKLSQAEQLIDDTLTIVKTAENTGELSFTVGANTVYGLDDIFITLIKS